MSESWRPIEGFSRYEVSDRGCVRVVRTGQVLRPDCSDTGHLRVRLINDGGARCMRWVHRLVLVTFELAAPERRGRPPQRAHGPG